MALPAIGDDYTTLLDKKYSPLAHRQGTQVTTTKRQGFCRVNFRIGLGSMTASNAGRHLGFLLEL